MPDGARTLFTEVSYDLGSLMGSIALGEIGLPDIQRPFVWENAKVRNLFDSMYRGYPVGYLLLWKNGASDDSKAIGAEHKQKPPRLLIVDGQQRLTSLYAVTKGIAVVRENYEKERIEIAFNPLIQRFEVADAAIKRDKSFIPDISRVWAKDADIFELVDEYVNALKTTREVSQEEIKAIRSSVGKLQGLLSFPFRALELAATVSEEQVAEVFVRINSQGKTLNQSDFILTLMSVFWDEGRRQLEEFCKSARIPTKGEPSSFNYFIQPDPDQLLRVSVALAFKRAKLQYVYSILRGKDLDTGEFSDKRRDEQFGRLKESQAKVLNLQHWHDFLKAVMTAGYRSDKMISSQNNLIFAYILYLFGRTVYNVEQGKLRAVVARWFFMSNLTGRFTGSPESAMEFDLARFRDVTDGSMFVAILNRICDEALTSDFWSITFPNELATASPRSPSLFAFYASLVLQDATALFSNLKVAELLDPALNANREALERHHLFPKKHLKQLGIKAVRETNQIANFALLEWHDNSLISSKAPQDYMEEIKKEIPPKILGSMYGWHAMPDGWELMPYQDFLARRRELIAKVVKSGYDKLSESGGKVSTAPAISVQELINGGETISIEFKSALRTNLHTRQADPKIEMSVLKTIAGFLNSKSGGTLIVGVADDGTPVGLQEDGFPDEDKMCLHLANLLGGKIGAQYSVYIHPRFEDHEKGRVLVVECMPSKSPVFVKDGQTERFFVRSGTSTAELLASQTQQYVRERF